MSFLKQYGTSAKGNDRLLKQYGGSAGSSPMARQHYAKGGAVKGKEGNPSLAEGLEAADGAPSKPSLARPGRKMAKKGGDDKKDAKTNVNIIIAGKSPDAGPKAAPPMPPPDMPMPPPGGAGPGPGGPPMPMRKHGGAVGRFATGGRITNLGKYAHGGKVKRADGGWTGEGDSGKAAKEKAADLREKASANEKGAKSSLYSGALAAGAGVTGPKFSEMGKVGKTLKGGALASGIANLGMAGLQKVQAMSDRDKADRADKAGDEAEGRKRGGSVKSHISRSDEAEDKKVRGDDHEFAKGGKVSDGGDFHGLRNEDGGSMGGKARLAKVKMYGR